MGLPYIGCFKDKGKRDLPTLLNGKASPTECFRAAREKGFEFVGLQYSGECWAGNTVGKYGDAPDGECNRKCKKEPAMNCGGSWRNSVWFTGHLTFEKHMNYCVTASGKDLT
jgi:hypothetical protein